MISTVCNDFRPGDGQVIKITFAYCCYWYSFVLILWIHRKLSYVCPLSQRFAIMMTRMMMITIVMTMVSMMTVMTMMELMCINDKRLITTIKLLMLIMINGDDDSDDDNDDDYNNEDNYRPPQS